MNQVAKFIVGQIYLILLKVQDRFEILVSSNCLTYTYRYSCKLVRPRQGPMLMRLMNRLTVLPVLCALSLSLTFNFYQCLSDD